MISRMREYFRGLKFVLLFVIVAFIATSVVYFGTSSPDGRAGDLRVAATVNGEVVPMERFQRAYASYMEFYRQVYRERLTREIAERLGLADQVVTDLINEALIVQHAAREGVRVSDEELRARIQTLRAFQENGRFSRERYLAVLRQARIDPAEFETEQRRDIQRRKMEGLVKDGAKVSEEEIRQAYAFRHERVRAAWAHLDTGPLLGATTVSDAEAEAYLRNHPAQFTRPERRRLQYIVVSAKPVAASVSDAEAEAYYREHAAEFERPRRARTAHVLVRVPPTGGSDAEKQARAKVEDVIRRAKAGEDFGKLAREVSEDQASAAQGGDLGLVGPGEMVPQFEQAVMALGKGEVSAVPVRTPFGYHAIKVLDVEAGGRPPFKDVAARIKDKLAGERAERSARTRAEAVRGAVQPTADFGAAVRAAGFEPREATVARGEELAGVGRDPALDEAVFALAPGGVSAPIKVGEAITVLKVVDQLPGGVPPLAEIKAQVVEAAKRERVQAQASERAKALAAGAGEDFAARARRDGFAVGETPLFSRADPAKDRPPLPPSVMVAALQTAVGQVADPVATPTGVYVVRTLERRPPEMQGLEKERGELERQVLERKRANLWESWIRSARADAKVEVSPQLTARAR